MTLPAADIDVVIIGRNEGERLRRCLLSVPGAAGSLRTRVIYVDSGSTDGSVALARSLEAEVVELDMSRPFTAARGRNAGFALVTAPNVQFVDGDCELREGWLAAGARELAERPSTVVTFGRLRERYPQRSIYNRLSDIEWDTLAGEAPFCGGISMMRADAVRAAGAFDESIVAGEEPDLCFRLRAAGGVVRAIDADMCWHDADMTRFRQWWRRQVRSGFGMAQVTAASGERYFARPLLSAAVWGVGMPLLIIAAASLAPFGLAPLWTPFALLAVLLLSVARIARRGMGKGLSATHAAVYGALTMLSKSAIALGAFRQLTEGRRHTARGAFHKDAPSKPAPNHQQPAEAAA